MINRSLEQIFANPRGSAGMLENVPQLQVMRDGSGVSCRAPWTIGAASKTRSLITDEERRLVQMNRRGDDMHMRCQRRGGPQEQYSSARQRHWDIYTKAQDGVVPVRRTDGVDRAFPLKPVHHKRTVTLRTQGSLDPYEFEKLSVSSHPRGHSEVIRNGKNVNKKLMEVPLLSQEHLSNGTREATGSQQPRGDSHIQTNGQQRVAEAIHAKELIIQEKLWRLEEKIRKKIQRESSATGDDDQKREEEWHGRRRAEQEKDWRETRVSPAEQQRREPVQRRETARQDKRREDIKQERKKQDQWTKDRMRNTHEEEGGRWDGREIEIVQKPQSKRDRDRGTVVVRAHERGENGELSRWKWENVKEKEQNRRKEGNGKDIRIGGETRVRSQQEKEKAKEREQSKTSKEDVDWTRERTSKERYGSNADEREQGLPGKSQQKPARRPATENHSGKGRRTSGEPSLPAVSRPSQPSRVELSPRESADTCLQLLPCKICSRKFSAERLEKHLEVCEKVKQKSHRKVFNSYSHRTKGTSLEEFLKTHTRGSTPERKNNWRQNHEVFTRNQRQGRVPGGTLQPKPPVQANPDYVTCPHCSRRFGPRPAERHIPKCQHIKSRPPPPRHCQ